MHLLSIRIITAGIKRLVQFYETVTRQSFMWLYEDLAQVQTASAALAIGSTRTLGFFGGFTLLRIAPLSPKPGETSTHIC